MKMKGIMALGAKQLIEVQAGYDNATAPRVLRGALMIDPGGEAAPAPETGAVKIGLMMDPGGHN